MMNTETSSRNANWRLHSTAAGDLCKRSIKLDRTEILTYNENKFEFILLLLGQNTQYRFLSIDLLYLF